MREGAGRKIHERLLGPPVTLSKQTRRVVMYCSIPRSANCYLERSKYLVRTQTNPLLSLVYHVLRLL